MNSNGTLSGLAGNSIFRSYNGQTFVYAKQDRVRNPQTRGQMMQRTKKQNIVALYGGLKPSLKDNFQGKKGGQSDYSMFVGCNLSQQPVYLTKQEAMLASNAIVAPYVVSFGTLASVGYVLQDGWLVSDIFVDDFQLTDQTKLCELAEAVLGNNDEWKKDDVLEFIVCKQLDKKDENGQVVGGNVTCDYANLTLDTVDRSSLDRMLDAIELKVNEEGYLCMKAEGEGGFAIVRKRNSPKGVMTGVQIMEVCNSLLEKYTSEEQCEKAIESYR